VPEVNPHLAGERHQAGPELLAHYLEPRPLRLEQPVNPYADSSSSTNAAGTAENLALHVAMVVAFALVGIYVLRQSGFRFVIAAGVG
jgi:hypothetical protein